MSIHALPARGCYRLAQGVRLVTQGEQRLAILEYPLRVVRLNSTTARVLSFCQEEERTCEQLAHMMPMPIKRVEALCDQLRWKNLLEAGPLFPPATWPSVSIVIPSYNRAKELERCLQSLFKLDYLAACLEIIIVDDASTDETEEMVQRLVQDGANYDLVIRMRRHEHQQGVAISRNTGAEIARYDLIAYIDSDCVASPSWLTELVPAFQDGRVAAVGGMIRAYARNTLLGRYEDVRSSLFMGERTQQIRLEGPLTYLPTANLLIRRTHWQQLGGFAPLTQGEDVDFCRRLLQTGASIHYLPRGIIYHNYRTNLNAFLRIRAAYASSEAALLQRHPTERRVLLLPPEQATFAGAIVAALWAIMIGTSPRAMHTRKAYRRSTWGLYSWLSLLPMLLALFTTISGTRTRLHKVREQHVPISSQTVLNATLRGNLSYTYHLCRHLTRYYTLPLMLIGILVPSLFILLGIFFGIVTIVDYVRLKPNMSIHTYAFCSFLDDCAYEVGLVQGCIKQRTWKPLVPIIRKRL